MSIAICSKKYKTRLDVMISDLQEILQDITSVNDFGWNGRKYASIAATALEQIKFYLRNKRAIDDSNDGFYKYKRELEAHFKKIELELDMVRNILNG